MRPICSRLASPPSTSTSSSSLFGHPRRFTTVRTRYLPGGKTGPDAPSPRESSEELPCYPPREILDQFEPSRPKPSVSFLPSVGRLKGAKIFKMGDGHGIVPLLMADRDGGLPICMGLELFTDSPRGYKARRCNESVVELHYVLDGEGWVSARSSPSGPVQHDALRPGDSFLARPGTQLFVRPSGPSSASAWRMASLVVLMPASDAKPTGGEGQAGGGAGSDGPALSLESLMSSFDEMLEGPHSPYSADLPGASDPWAGLDGGRLSVHQVALAEWFGGECLGILKWDDLRALLLKAALNASTLTGALHAVPHGSIPHAELPPPSPPPALDPPSPLQRASAFLQAMWRQVQANAKGEVPPGECLLKRTLTELEAFEFPKQNNRLALVFDPLQEIEKFRTAFTFGVEVFEAGHVTPPHLHPHSHELFFILSGHGMAFCDGNTFEVGPGDAVVFPPYSVHGINVDPASRLYCLELMLPRDGQVFAQHVRSGRRTGPLDEKDLCDLLGSTASPGCGAPTIGDTIALSSPTPQAPEPHLD